MNEDEFKNYFDKVLYTHVPSEASSSIRDYWQRFGVSPTFFLDDASIDASFGASTPVAAVTGRFCFHKFAFRPFIYTHAPEPILRTIVQHEIAHCYLHRDEGFEDRIISNAFEPLTARPLDPIGLTHERLDRIYRYNREERRVSRTNSSWGGNDAEAWAWCEKFWSRK